MSAFADELKQLGDPKDLFYWGPTSAKAMYMSDFMAAAERLFVAMAKNPDLPTPPKTIVLFHSGQMVWINNAHEFGEFVEKTFEAYKKLNQLEDDIAKWEKAAKQLPKLYEAEFNKTIVDAWYATEFAEFSLYGAESALIKTLERLDKLARQEVWDVFTVPDKPTFLTKIDAELAESQNPKHMAAKYPWIQDGYDGVTRNAEQYFKERLEIVGTEAPPAKDHASKRKQLITKYSLTDQEVNALTLARHLAEFMDDRKGWMMQTRHLIKKSIGNIEYGWIFENGKVADITKEDTEELWRHFVDFKTSHNAVKGMVASNGGLDSIEGEVVIVESPTDNVADDRVVVVPFTSPSYVPLMRKARALVTDHGGMMSHAAIVAREFNLPCIVGTMQATKILKTGDKVVLDLEKGEITK